MAAKNINAADHTELVGINREVGSMLGSIIKIPEKFLTSSAS